MCATAAPLALTQARSPRPVLIKAYLKGWESDLLTLADLFGRVTLPSLLMMRATT